MKAKLALLGVLATVISAMLVAPAQALAPTLTLGAVTKNTTAGTAKVPATVNQAGTLVLSGNKVVTKTKTPTGPGTFNMKVRAKGEALTTLNNTGEVKVRVHVT